MALVSNPYSADSPHHPWLGGIAGLLAGGVILYFWPRWNRTRLSLVPVPASVYTRFLGVMLEEVPLIAYGHQALLGSLMVLLTPGYGKSTFATWMMHNPASSRRWPGEVLRAQGIKSGLLIIVLCNSSFLSRVGSGALALYIFIFQHVSVAVAVASGVLSLRDARHLACTLDAQSADLRLFVISTLGFQTILPAQIALMNARGVSTPLGWYIVVVQTAEVLLASMLAGGLVVTLRSLLDEERCRAWRGDMVLFNGAATLCAMGFLIYNMTSAYPRIFAVLHQPRQSRFSALCQKHKETAGAAAPVIR